MDTVNLRQSIAQAKLLEQQTGLLAAHLSKKAKSLHHAIKMPPSDKVSILLDFIVRYTEHVAELIDVLNAIGINANCSEYTDAVVFVCAELFESPPPVLSNHQDLSALMGKAYLAHRVIEEINEHFAQQCNEPLIPMDMTRSNLIVHQLIGEPFANLLDDIAQIIAEQLERGHLLLDNGVFNQSASRAIAWGIEVNHWPCLTDTLAVDLLLEKIAIKPATLH